MTADEEKALTRAIMAALAQVWDAGWVCALHGGKNWYNPFGKPAQ